MKRATIWVGTLLLVLVALAIIQTIDVRSARSGVSKQADESILTTPGRDAGIKMPSFSGAPAASATHAMGQAHALLNENPSSGHEILASLRAELFHGDLESSARAVSDFLRSRRDAATGMGFSLGADGVLATAPTLRTALLNWHPSLDPLVSLEMAREILKSTDSADEYAVAMRNLAWNDHDGDLKPELHAAFQHMFNRRDWRADPTAGYLESFDVAVALGDPLTFQMLAECSNPDANDPSIVRAASMSMDRMVLREPGHLADAWNENPQWMDQAPMQRASLLSRLDITREDHRAVFMDYLSSDRITPEEREYFEALYPNGNHLHGHRLVTTNEPSPTIDERAEMDREILRELVDLSEQAPASATESLRKIRERMSSFVME